MIDERPHARDGRAGRAARAAGAEVVDVEVGSYANADDVEGVYSFTVVDPEGHRWLFDGGVALSG